MWLTILLTQSLVWLTERLHQLALPLPTLLLRPPLAALRNVSRIQLATKWLVHLHATLLENGLDAQSLNKEFAALTASYVFTCLDQGDNLILKMLI
jgi:hypothetical protein